MSKTNEDKPSVENEYKLEEIRKSSASKNSVTAKTQTDTSISNNNNDMPASQSTNQTPATRANLEPSATVKVVLLPMNQVVTLACSLRMSIKELKAQLSNDLKMNPQHLQIIHGKDSKSCFSSLLHSDSVEIFAKTLFLFTSFAYFLLKLEFLNKSTKINHNLYQKTA